MLELSGFDIFVPAIVAALVTFFRQFTEKLDGPSAYWVAMGLNVAAQVTAELAGDGGGGGALANAAAMGVAGGATVSAGIATAGKRVGLGRVIKPRADDK